jgi:hypothetical protein
LLRLLLALALLALLALLAPALALLALLALDGSLGREHWGPRMAIALDQGEERYREYENENGSAIKSSYPP